jgi:hypothetical protein
VFEVVLALVMAVEAADGANGFPEFLDGSCSDPPEMSLEFGKGHFDRIEVGVVGLDRLSKMTMSPGRKVGASWVST